MSPAPVTGVLCTPLRVEQAALRRAGHSLRLVRTGMGPRRAAATATRLSRTDPVIVAGVAAAQTPHVQSGDVVVATQVRTRVAVSGAVPAPVEIRSAPLLAGALRRSGLRVHLGVISSVPRIARRPLGDGSVAVDMESAQLAADDRPYAVVRTIVDTPDHPLWRIGTLWRGVSALRSLAACRPALEWWVAATGGRDVSLVAPLPRAVRAIAQQVDLVLVARSPDSLRLVELAQREGVPAYLVDEVSEIDLRWLAGRTRLGITAGACAPPDLVDEIVQCLGGLGPVTVRESRLIEEDLTYTAPEEVS